MYLWYYVDCRQQDSLGNEYKEYNIQEAHWASGEPPRV
jgi:hypothetical protein